MQPTEANKGCPPKSRLLDSLTVYLNNKKRLQPIIGLGCITECLKMGAQDREVLYLCEVCVCRLSKDDIRNHIMGSLHRYNYIRAWHPDLVSEWKENCDLSKLAWPLMEIAKTLEGKEGPGEVQLIELEDAIYQTMAVFSESEVTLIQILRTRHVRLEPESHFEASSVQPQRTVLLSENQQRWSDTNPDMFLDAFRSSESGFSFLDSYRGTEPLIGVSRVVECRGEDGHTYCFLCHCCRIRSTKNIIDHLTSSSHLVNYLVETRPELMEVLTASTSEDYQLLQSLAKSVEQEEGRGELQVVKPPESLCVQLTERSYHWCLKMLCEGWTQTDIQGPNGNREMTETGATSLSESRKGRKTAKKMMEKRTTVFRVSLPHSQGSLLLRRTSFCEDTFQPEAWEYMLPSGSDRIHSTESGSEENLLNFDTTLGSERNITVKISGEEMGFQSGDEHLNQYRNFSGREEQISHEGNNDNGQNTPQDPSSEMLNREWRNNYPQVQNEWMLPPGCPTPDWASYYASYGHVEWYTPTSQSTVHTEVPTENTQSEAISHAPLGCNYYDYYNYYSDYYQQQAHHQYMAQNGPSLQTAVDGRMDYLVDQMFT
ncbi:uncharacterized protein si:ch211-199g17.2 isoform X2 [Notolabrus celidotus]|uniref:uncharacterized protein si:ch211-199g17.2 isoform X2 n=1 Tax=Notolabrus celidotus TaxID=1203425 RepID=UPI00148F8813|nr:uncharacterized protein si:ch211-199g17.2 isoform X2 [Notolabrus celidotus]